MSTWNTTSTNSRFGSTVVGPAIEGSSSTAWRSKQSLSIPFRTSPWSNVPREQRVRPQPVGAKTGNPSEVNNHLEIIKELLRSSGPDRGRARLIIVYTGENDLNQIAASIRAALKVPEQTDSDDPCTSERGAA